MVPPATVGKFLHYLWAYWAEKGNGRVGREGVKMLGCSKIEQVCETIKYQLGDGGIHNDSR
jgi:hypothetical protein